MEVPSHYALRYSRLGRPGALLQRTIIAFACLPALACAAAQNPEGRWEGAVRIPGRELQVVVDLAPDSANVWTGSIIIPGLGIKGAPLSSVAVRDAGVTFDTGKLLGGAADGSAVFSAQLLAADDMAGEMTQAGNVAKFSLRKTGPAQVERGPRSTRVARDFEDQWNGEFELGGYPRHVSLTLENHAGSAATATFVVVGKKTTELAVDLVLQEGEFLRIESQASQVTFEGRYSGQRGEIDGTLSLGPIEMPLMLRRSARRTS